MDFREAVCGAFETILNTAGIEVTYHRGNLFNTIQAVPGQSRFRTSGDDLGIAVDFRTRDYLIPSPLILAGTPIEPQRGDLIKETVGNQIHTYELTSPGGDELVWRYSDTGRQVIRVHTNLQKMEAM